jgi:hypothetical protein
MFWKATIQFFDIIDTHLAWDPGNGRQVHLSRDAIVGISSRDSLPEDLIARLNEEIFRTSWMFMINQFSCSGT